MTMGAVDLLRARAHEPRQARTATHARGDRERRVRVTQRVGAAMIWLAVFVSIVLVGIYYIAA